MEIQLPLWAILPIYLALTGVCMGIQFAGYCVEKLTAPAQISPVQVQIGATLQTANLLMVFLGTALFSTALQPCVIAAFVLLSVIWTAIVIDLTSRWMQMRRWKTANGIVDPPEEPAPLVTVSTDYSGTAAIILIPLSIYLMPSIYAAPLLLAGIALFERAVVAEERRARHED